MSIAVWSYSVPSDVRGDLAMVPDRGPCAVWQDMNGRWLWVAREGARAGRVEPIGRWDKRPGFDRWRFAWTRAKHLRRAAEAYRDPSPFRVHGGDGEALCRACRMDKAAAAYREAADRADWGCRP